MLGNIKKLRWSKLGRFVHTVNPVLPSGFTAHEHLYNMKPPLTTKDEIDSDEEDDRAIETEFDDTMLNDPSPTLRIGKFLFKAGRSRSKVQTHLPEWFEKKKVEICKYRTPAQIRRSLKNWMIDFDRDYQKTFLKMPLKWRADEPLNQKDVKSTIVYGPDEAVAYSYYFMSSRFGILYSILSDMKKIIPNFTPKNVIDFGCGPGTAGAAAIAVHDDKVKKYVGIDMSKSMLESAQIIIEGSNQNVGCVLWDKIGEAVRRAEGRNERYDLAFLSYTLSELSSDSAKRAAVQVMFELLDVGGCLVIVEEGNPRGSHIVRTARQYLLDYFNGEARRKEVKKEFMEEKKKRDAKRKASKKTEKDSEDAQDEDEDIFVNSDFDFKFLISPPGKFDHEQLGAKTIAPCTHDRPCPLNKGLFCSFTQKVRGGVIRKSSEEKYSYVVIQKVAKGGSSATGANSTATKSLLSRISGAKTAAILADKWLEPSPLPRSMDIDEDLSDLLRKRRKMKKEYLSKRLMKELEDDDEYEGEEDDDIEENFDDMDENEDLHRMKLNPDVRKALQSSGETEKLRKFDAGDEDSEDSEDSSDEESEELDWSQLPPKERRYLEQQMALEKDLEKMNQYVFDQKLADLLEERKKRGETDLSPRDILMEYMRCESESDVNDLNDILVEDIDWEEYSPPMHRDQWNRVIRSPIKKKGHIIVDTCNSNGKMQRSLFSKANLSHVPSLYTGLRKVTWGGLFPADVDFEVEKGSLIKRNDEKSIPKAGAFKFSEEHVAAKYTKSERQLRRLQSELHAKNRETDEINEAMGEMTKMFNEKSASDDEIGRRVDNRNVLRRGRVRANKDSISMDENSIMDLFNQMEMTGESDIMSAAAKKRDEVLQNKGKYNQSVDNDDLDDYDDFEQLAIESRRNQKKLSRSKTSSTTSPSELKLKDSQVHQMSPTEPSRGRRRGK